MNAFKATLRILVPVLAFGFLGIQLHGLSQNIDDSQMSFRLDILTSSMALLGMLFMIDAAGWNLILRALHQRLPWGKALYIWFYSSLSRYIPGVVWPYLSRMQMCADQGIDKATTAASMMLENLLLAGTSLVLSSPLLFIYLEIDGVQATGLFLLFLAGLAAMIYLSRAAFIKNIIDRYLPSLKSFTWHALFQLVLYYLTFWLLFGYCFLLFSQSIVNVAPEHIFTVALAFPVSFAIGFIASVSPGGLGIREGALFALLSSQLGSTTAALLAITSRIWLIAIELLIAIGIAIILIIRKSFRHPP